MTELDIEIAGRASRGFALAGRVGDMRVYRGQGRIETEGAPPTRAEDKAEFERLSAQIERLDGHIGWQGHKRRLVGAPAA